MTRLIIFIIACFSLAACAPQAELVKTRSEMSDLREDVKTVKARLAEQLKDTPKRLDDMRMETQKRLDLLDANIKGTLDAQKVMADYGARSDQLTTDIQILQGKIEENNFRIAELAQKLDDKSFRISELTSKAAELTSKLDDLEAKVKGLETVVAAISTGQTGTGLISAVVGTAAEIEKKPAPRTIEPSEAYRQAMNDFNSGSFDLALGGFQNYLVQYPDTSQADKAQYWIGECHYSKKDFGKAIDAFSKVVKTYPRSDKVPGAKLKIALSYMNEKNNAKAKEYFHKVTKEYPGTKEAELAKEKLKKMSK